jgi:hypothetical protein
MKESFVKFQDLIVNNSNDIAEIISNSWYNMKEYEDDIDYISDYFYNSRNPMRESNNTICKKLRTKESIVLGNSLAQTIRNAALGTVPDNRKKRIAALVAMLDIATNGEYLEDISERIFEIGQENDYADRGISRMIALFCFQNNWIIDICIDLGNSTISHHYNILN